MDLQTDQEYECLADIDIYDSCQCDRLTTQAKRGRHLQVVELGEQNIQVCLCEDSYPGWLNPSDANKLKVAGNNYVAKAVTRSAIVSQLNQVIDFTYRAMNTPNSYLWGGTIGPNYDCSGLMQAAFLSIGVWLPRDAYQQEPFTQPIEFEQPADLLELMQAGDLVFFGTRQKATHVGLYLGDGRYIHSSGKDQGRNGIGIDVLSADGDAISQNYYRQLRGAGRLMASYLPQEKNC
ncbi:MAG: NlpC/P60 family protein [Microcoleaceae cyanobacterium]